MPLEYLVSRKSLPRAAYIANYQLKLCFIRSPNTVAGVSVDIITRTGEGGSPAEIM